MGLVLPAAVARRLFIDLTILAQVEDEKRNQNRGRTLFSRRSLKGKAGPKQEGNGAPVRRVVSPVQYPNRRLMIALARGWGLNTLCSETASARVKKCIMGQWLNTLMRMPRRLLAVLRHFSFDQSQFSGANAYVRYRRAPVQRFRVESCSFVRKM